MEIDPADLIRAWMDRRRVAARLGDPADIPMELRPRPPAGRCSSRCGWVREAQLYDVNAWRKHRLAYLASGARPAEIGNSARTA